MSPKQHPDLLSCNFNQDFSCVSVGTKKGYSIINCDPYGKIYSKNEGATSIVEMLFCTSLVALVGSAGKLPSASPRKLQIVNTKRQSTICELLFPTSILAVKMNRKRLVVVLELEIYIYDISTMKLLHTLETGSNPNGNWFVRRINIDDTGRKTAICALSPSNDNSYLAYPAPPPSSSSPLTTQPPPPPTSTTGTLLLFDTLTLSAQNIIMAHKSPIACVAINSQGTMLATASDKGTVIRVYSVPEARKLGEYRRGTKQARVWSMNFNTAGTLLVVGSDTETVHVYKLDDPSAPTRRGVGNRSISSSSAAPPSDDGRSSPPLSAPSSPTLSHLTPSSPPQHDQPSGGVSSFSRRGLHLGKNLVGGMGGYLPKGVTEMWEPRRDFGFVRLRNGGGGRCVVAMSPSSPHVMVITSEGLFQAYAIDLEQGGECSLIKEFPLITEDSGSSSMAD